MPRSCSASSERRGEVLSVDQIALAVWGHATLGSPNFVEAQISRVRSHLATAGAGDVIRTVRSVGYVIRP
jgi:DNA-binding response OmpR family regulator